MTKHEVFAEFFTNLLKLENQQQARSIAEKVWPATHDMWIYPMKIDPVLIRLGLAHVMEDGRIGYLAPQDQNLPWRQSNWETEEPTAEQETKMRAPHERRVVLQDGTEVSWSSLKRMAAKDHVWFQVPDDESDLSFRMGPDHFPGSSVLAWITLEEKAGGSDAFQDNRVRSNEPDDFLSRIDHLSSGADGPFVPKD